MNNQGIAKAGDKITAKARKVLEQRLGYTPETVQPKAEGAQGQWFCITCGDLPQNNFQAQTHRDECPKHKLAWRNFESGQVEEP